MMKLAQSIEWSSCAITHSGNMRDVNQDAFISSPEGRHLWVVADGMGGHKDGHIASNAIVSQFRSFVPEKTMGATVNKIYQRLDDVNRGLIERAKLTGENDVIGSTVVIFYASQYSGVVTWSGDSRLYLFRQGRLKQLTRDHNNESVWLDEGISPDEIKNHPYAQALTHAIGGEPAIYLESQLQEIKHDDLFLLCSDGLNKEVSNDEIESILSQQPYQKAMSSLMNLSLQRGGRDNITIILASATVL